MKKPEHSVRIQAHLLQQDNFSGNSNNHKFLLAHVITYFECRSVAASPSKIWLDGSCTRLPNLTSVLWYGIHSFMLASSSTMLTASQHNHFMFVLGVIQHLSKTPPYFKLGEANESSFSQSVYKCPQLHSFMHTNNLVGRLSVTCHTFPIILDIKIFIY